MRYSLLAAGKHFRPVLFLSCLEELGQPALNGRLTALALECLHTYSLIHDDLPCMDDDDYRRGQLSAHRRFGEAQAVLSGDALLTLAFELVAHEPESVSGQLARELARAAGAAGMVAGQLTDLEMEGRDAGVKELETMHRLKTGALLSACTAMAGLRAHVAGTEVSALRGIGEEIGLIFQIRDDILDVVSNLEHIGKNVGKDARRGKLTYPGLLGLEGARAALRDRAGRARSAMEDLGLCRRTLSKVIDDLEQLPT